MKKEMVFPVPAAHFPASFDLCLVSYLMSGFGGDCAGGGAKEEPFGGAGRAAPDAAAFGDADGVVALLGEGGGLGFFVGKIALGGGQLGLAGLAVEGEVVEWF